MEIPTVTVTVTHEEDDRVPRSPRRSPTQERSSKQMRRSSPFRKPREVMEIPPVRFHRHFVLVANRPLPSAINLNDLTYGRIDLICRSISAALFLSHGTRTNTKIWVVFPKGLDGCPIVLSISGDEARHVRPDERNIASLLRLAMYPQTENVRRKSLHCLKGLRVIQGSLEDALTFSVSSHPNTDLCLLSPTLGADNCLLGNGRYMHPDDAACQGNRAIVVVLGDDRGLHEDQEDMILAAGARPVSLGPVSLLGSHCITLTHHYLDREKGRVEGFHKVASCCEGRRVTNHRSRFRRPPTPAEFDLYREAFEALDTDGSGLIEISELHAAFAAIHGHARGGGGGGSGGGGSRPTSPAPGRKGGSGDLPYTSGISEMEVEFIMKCLDDNSDGVLSLDEFVDLVREEKGWEEEEYLSRAFKALDKERKGFITTLDLKTVMELNGQQLTDAEANVMIEQADTRGDGRVYFDDFVRLLQY